MVLQLAISLAGVALMVGLSWALFGLRDAPIADADTVRASLARDVPGFRAGRFALSRDAGAALVEDAADGAVYLAVARGDSLVTRKLARGTKLARDGDRLTLDLRDFTLKRAALELDDAAWWERRLA
jgi:hypothetical protein